MERLFLFFLFLFSAAKFEDCKPTSFATQNYSKDILKQVAVKMNIFFTLNRHSKYIPFMVHFKSFGM